MSLTEREKTITCQAFPSQEYCVLFSRTRICDPCLLTHWCDVTLRGREKGNWIEREREKERWVCDTRRERERSERNEILRE